MCGAKASLQSGTSVSSVLHVYPRGCLCPSPSAHPQNITGGGSRQRGGRERPAAEGLFLLNVIPIDPQTSAVLLPLLLVCDGLLKPTGGQTGGDALTLRLK